MVNIPESALIGSGPNLESPTLEHNDIYADAGFTVWRPIVRINGDPIQFIYNSLINKQVYIVSEEHAHRYTKRFSGTPSDLKATLDYQVDTLPEEMLAVLEPKIVTEPSDGKVGVAYSITGAARQKLTAEHRTLLESLNNVTGSKINTRPDFKVYHCWLREKDVSTKNLTIILGKIGLVPVLGKIESRKS